MKERLTEKIIDKKTWKVLGYENKRGTTVLKAIQKLGEYETADEEGRLVVLPCKVGTRVYEIYQFCGYGAWEIEEHKIKLEDLDKIGKTVFLTRGEAEKALKEMEGRHE